MRLPFVSRARYALLAHNFAKARQLAAETKVEHNARIESYHADLNRAIDSMQSFKALWEAERVRNDRLVDKILTMKQAGFSTATERLAPPVSPPSKVEDAIAEKAGSNGALRRHLTRWAAQRQAMDMPEDEIVGSLMNWKDPDEGEQ